MSVHNAAQRFDRSHLQLTRQKDTRIILRKSLSTLIDFTEALRTALEVLESPDVVNVDEGIDFYREVQRFEVALIERALGRTGGSQTKAARLLGLNLTTLNSKIKSYELGKKDPRQ